MVDKDLALTALGKQMADLVIRGGKLVNVLTEEIYPADVAIKASKIAYVGDATHCTGPQTQVIDASNKYLVPGLIDGHIHPEACKIPLTRLAEAVLPHGTTTIFAAMDEHWSVTGPSGVRFALDEARKTPLRVIYHPYARVPVTGTEPSSTPAHRFGAKEAKLVTEWPDTVGPMDMVIDWVLSFDDDVMEEMRHFQENGYLVHGHDTFERGPRMQAFLTTGIRSDHVPFSPDEALEKLRSGMWVMFSDSPIARILPDVLKALTETRISTRHASYCIDDMDSRDIIETGHLDHQVRTAVGAGLDPIHAVQMATLNAAELHRKDHVIGSIAPGKAADVLIVDDLVRFNVERVIAGGELVAENGKMIKTLAHPQYPAFFSNTFHMGRRVTPDDLVMHVDPAAKEAKVLALHIPPYNPMRFRREACLTVVNGEIQADVVNDVLYCAVIERHKATGNIGRGFLSGFNLGGGTIASSIGSPTCNVICVGSNKDDMAMAVNYVAEKGGGQVAVRDGKIEAEVPLPLGGFMADIPAEEMAVKERALADILHAWGCPMERPLFFLMFLEIVPLPDYALTEHGVVEFASLKYVDPLLEVIRE